MYIKDIILDGFKIYENKTVIRNLDKSYNAITGLNGSGKSNIIDGIIFALGLESKKLLRTNTLKELINVHRKECKVTLILSNTDKSKSPEGYKEYNEILLARSIDSTGKNKFFLNNHSCSLTTINKLCLSMNINSEKGEFFFIIMQGHITKILNMKSREIGNLIEETAGTRSYTKEKEKAILALEKKESKLVEVRDTLQRRISPFYSRLREEREAYIEQKNLEQTKNDIQAEQKKIQNTLLVDDISKNVLNLKGVVESYILDKNQLISLEAKLTELQEFEVEDNVLSIKEVLDDEKLKLEDFKKTDPSKKIINLQDDLDNITIVNKKFNLQELKERESYLLRSIKNENGVGNKDFEILEELGNLKLKKTELEYQLKCLNDLDLQEINNKISNIEKYKVDPEEIKSDNDRLNYLKLKLNYPIKNDVYGTIDENITFKDEKYKEAIFTIMGSKSKHVIVADEKVGSELLNSSDRRISVIPLNKIKSKFVDRNIVKKVNSEKGLHMIDLLEFDNKLRKAMEHVFNGFFVFEDRETAKRVCFDLKVMCVTTDGNIYDPKGTLTGGKSTFKNEIISSAEILELQTKIDKAEKNLEYFYKYSEEYNALKIKRNKCNDKEKLKEQLKITDVKIKTITEFDLNTADVRKEISEVRRKILEAIKEENAYNEIIKKQDKLSNEISRLTKIAKENDANQENCINKIMKLQDKLGELEIKTSNKRLSERQIEGLEPKQKYLIRSTAKAKNRISKIKSELEDMLNKLENKDSYMIPGHKNSISTNWTEMYTEGENQQIFESLDIDEKIFNFNISEVEESEHKALLSRLSELNIALERCNSKNTVRMDPSNFDLLEKNELIIQSLKDKITQLELDKSNILNSITSFDLLGVKENEKAFKHLNNRVGIFLRYFLKDSDVKIEKIKNKNGFDEYELKVKIGNWKDSLSELSGGQRSLVALCLIFSILTYRPAPFYIFDEIDSALDLSYTQSIGEIIKKEFNNSQFIVISLKNGMYENADSVFKVFLKDVPMSKQDNFNFEESDDNEELDEIPLFQYSGGESENSDGEFDYDAEERDFKSTVLRLKLRAEDNLNVRHLVIAICSLLFFILTFVFINTKVSIKEKGGEFSEIRLGIIFLNLFLSCLIIMFLSFLFYRLPCFYISELSEHLSIIVVCIFYICLFFYHRSNCCIPQNQGVEIYIGDLLNIILISTFLFAGLKLWSQSIGLNFNYQIYIERIRKCLVEDTFLSMFKRKNNPKRIAKLIKNFVTEWRMDLARRRLLFKEFQKNYKTSFRKLEKYKSNALKQANSLHFRALTNYRVTYISDISNLFNNNEYFNYDTKMDDQYSDFRNYNDEEKDGTPNIEISPVARALIKILNLPLKYRLDGNGFYRIIKRVDREKYILSKNLEQMNAALDRVCIFVQCLIIIIIAALMLYIKVSKELASTAGVISAIFGTQIISNSFSANAINSLIFLFIIHPYDIGDRIFVNLDNQLENLVVQELNVFSTVFSRWNGTCVYVANSLLSTKLITNIRRSGIIADSHRIQINARTDQSKLLSLKSTIDAFLRRHTEDFTEYCMVNYDFIENSNKLHMKIYMQYRTNSQNYEQYLKRKLTSCRFLIEHFRHLILNTVSLLREL